MAHNYHGNSGDRNNNESAPLTSGTEHQIHRAVPEILARHMKAISLAGLALFTAACGGGGGGGDDPPPLSTPFSQGTFPPSDQLANKCAAPRNFTVDTRGTATDEKYWIRSWINETYFWYDEVQDRNPAGPETTLEYFDLMKTDELSASGTPKDNFHFTYPTDEWEALSQSGISYGYGATFAVVSGTPPREVLVVYTEPGSPATSNGLSRGERIIEIDGESVTNGNADVLNAGLFPEDAGEVHSFTVEDLNSNTRSFNMTSAQVTSDPVQNVGVVPGTNNDVGYILFNDHIATAEAELVNAIELLTTANDGGQPVMDLILDVRYNGGGFLDIASELAYMIAGNTPTQDEVFEELRFNDKIAANNPPVSTPFHSESQGFSVDEGQALPTLNLPRVFVITGSGTCSASESIINGLRGVDVEVVQIGATTCGKPYGFYPTDNCGTTYFTIQFQGINAKGFGDFANGFSPVNALSSNGVSLPGCAVADDFNHQLGDPNEGRLAAAINYINTSGGVGVAGSCPAASASFSPSKASALVIAEPQIMKPFVLGGKALRQ